MTGMHTPADVVQRSSTDKKSADSLNLLDEKRGKMLATHKLEEIFKSSHKAFTDMRIMNWIAFAVGIILIGVSVGLGISGQREIYVSLFGGAGILSLFAIIFRPMKGVRDALSDFLQACVISDSFNHQIGVWFEFTHVQNEEGKEIRRTLTLEEAKEASKALHGIMESSTRLLREILENKDSKEDTK